MYGWRGRIGVIIPADNAVMEPDFHRLAPEGVSAHAAHRSFRTCQDIPRNTRRHHCLYVCCEQFRYGAKRQ